MPDYERALEIARSAHPARVLATEDLEIPPVAVLFPTTRRWRTVKPCGTGAAYRRHFRRNEPIDARCRAWHREQMRRWRSTGKEKV